MHGGKGKHKDTKANAWKGMTAKDRTSGPHKERINGTVDRGSMAVAGENKRNAVGWAHISRRDTLSME